MKIKAFTLAETLITLTIIGVVAALTIHNLMSRYQEQVTVNKVKKFYSTLNNAFLLSINENGTINNWKNFDSSEAGSNNIFEYFKPYLKIAKDCGIDNTGKCIGDKYYNFDDTEATPYANNLPDYKYRKLVLNDGSTIFFRGINTNDEKNLYYNDEHISMYIFYDVNGNKGPNKYFVDLFTFFATSSKLLPNGTPNSKQTYNQSCKNGICTSWLIYKGNMDYLHCNDLSWDRKDKCSK